MEAPIVAIESIDLKPGFKKKHTLLVDLNETQYTDLTGLISKAVIDFMNEDGRFGNLDAGEYAISFTPLKVEVKVK